jgi:hypothetical protein
MDHMSIGNGEGPVESSQARLQQTRAEIADELDAIRFRAPHRESPPGFPRSALMRAAMGHNGRLVLGGAALTLLLLRPGLVPVLARSMRVVPWIPVARGLLNRYVVRRKVLNE